MGKLKVGGSQGAADERDKTDSSGYRLRRIGGLAPKNQSPRREAPFGDAAPCGLANGVSRGGYAEWRESCCPRKSANLKGEVLCY
jgi:hypothetical protein